MTTKSLTRLHSLGPTRPVRNTTHLVHLYDLPSSNVIDLYVKVQFSLWWNTCEVNPSQVTENVNVLSLSF